MRSKKKKLLFICFSALIMIGLCIGVFADYNTDRVGTVVGSTPYDLGDMLCDFTTTHEYILEPGVYIFEFSFDQLASVAVNIKDSYILYENSSAGCFVRYFNDKSSNDYFYSMEPGHYYVYVEFSDSNESYDLISTNTVYPGVAKLYQINDTYTIDIYDNSQDVWASVVSVVNDATDSVINNDILLMFAAAIPVLSFGVGMLIRLVHKS